MSINPRREEEVYQALYEALDGLIGAGIDISGCGCCGSPRVGSWANKEFMIYGFEMPKADELKEKCRQMSKLRVNNLKEHRSGGGQQ